MLDSPQDGAGVGNIWTAHYPFDYWDNRIAKLNPHNTQDALDAIFILSHLSDVFVTVLTAKMRRPDFVWYVIKNELKPTREIYNTLEHLEATFDGETQYYIDKLLNKPEDLAHVNMPEEWEENVDYDTAFVSEFLGCPAEIDEEANELQTYYDPRFYIAVCNSVVNYWDENGELLNDFKHGFRVIPFSWKTMEWLFESGVISADVTVEEVKEGYDTLDSDWTYDFWRMEVGKNNGEAIPIELEVHTADIHKCKTFSQLILKLVYNMFETGAALTIDDEIESIFGTDEIKPQVPVMHQQYSLHTSFTED